MNKRNRSCLCVAAIAAVVICSGGCGDSGRPKTIPITGRLTIDGQPPGEVGRIRFTPIKAAEGYVKRPASGGFTAEGTYRVMSWEVDDGLVPGHYTVNVTPGDPNNTKIPTRYNQSGTSGLEVDVPVDQGPIEYNIDIVTQGSGPQPSANPNTNPNN